MPSSDGGPAVAGKALNGLKIISLEQTGTCTLLICYLVPRPPCAYEILTIRHVMLLSRFPVSSLSGAWHHNSTREGYQLAVDFTRTHTYPSDTTL